MDGDDRKVQHTTTILTFSILLSIVLVPAIVFVGAASTTFTPSVTVTNQPPTITIPASQSITGSAGTTAVVYIIFNATDINGAADLDNATAQITINRTGETSRTSSSCTPTTIDATKNGYNCSITILYYDAQGTWTVNASINDSSDNFVQNSTGSVTVNAIDAIALTQGSISFTGTPGTNDVAASPTPQRVNNTGNSDYTSVSVRGFSFTSGSNVLSVGNATVNVSASGGLGQVLINNTPIAVTSAALNKGAVSLQNLSFYLDIPAGLPSGAYTAQSAWQVTTA
jgi:hypothetical protein